MSDNFMLEHYECESELAIGVTRSGLDSCITLLTQIIERKGTTPGESNLDLSSPQCMGHTEPIRTELKSTNDVWRGLNSHLHIPFKCV
jgi:hypothetical protein